MTYNPATDFLALWRNIAGVLSKVEMPGLDYVVAALARTGLITVSVSATAPVANQAATAWLQAAVPSYSAEGALFLWNPITTAYVPATPALLLTLLQASAGESGVSWWTSTGGPPNNTVGNNGDFAVRLDEPNGIYGPKAAGAWPANPVPGTADVLTSTALDNAFGSTEGAMLYRGPTAWQALEIAGANAVITAIGGVPAWETLSLLFDTVFSGVEGSILYRDAAVWEALGPGTANQVLSSGGAGAPPTWAPRTAEFPSGTVMLFQQSAAPTGWTKQTAINDYGLRVTSGSVGVTSGTAFSTVFAQTSVGNTTLNVAAMPSHNHSFSNNPVVTGTGAVNTTTGASFSVPNGPQTTTINNTGGGGAHSHSIALALSYVDVIIATKN